VVSPQAASVTAKALEPMPWRTDPVSSTACDRCPYADHAAVNVMQQGVQRRLPRKDADPGCDCASARANCAHRRIDCRRVDSPYELDNASPGEEGHVVEFGGSA
jgi:hypothetical protein